ncbi:hypothetical protein AtubIFM54640_004556 [Aspergillus tubingensis]|nr:hypothetical protein AtubIFM54640_004556 [Aspergillus tubingensis]
MERRLRNTSCDAGNGAVGDTPASTSGPTISKHPTSHKMRVATLVLVAFSAVALALPTTNNVERAAADANVRQMDELTVAAISK